MPASARPVPTTPAPPLRSDSRAAIDVLPQPARLRKYRAEALTVSTVLPPTHDTELRAPDKRQAVQCQSTRTRSLAEVFHILAISRDVSRAAHRPSQIAGQVIAREFPATLRLEQPLLQAIADYFGPACATPTGFFLQTFEETFREF